MLDFDSMSVKQRVAHFEQRHGNDAVEIDEWLVFSDGAMRECNPMGLLREPPAEPYDAARIVVRYHEERLRRATRAFSERKDALLRTARTNLGEAQTPPPPCDLAAAKQELQRLRRGVVKCQADLDVARKDMEAKKPHWLRVREENTVANRARNEEFATAIEAINI
jgi:hypothetical protein